MQHISFYKDRLPFHPRSNVVIYFDVTGISAKRYYDLIITHYEAEKGSAAEGLSAMKHEKGSACRGALRGFES